MGKLMKALAIIMLLATIGAACVVLYGLNRLEPQVEQVIVTATPAWQAQDTFHALVEQLDTDTFNGRTFVEGASLNMQSCTFLTYTVRLKNNGFFPAEWISLSIQPKDGDVLQIGGAQANVLSARSAGDLTATILHMGDASDVQRQMNVVCYVFGERIAFGVTQSAELMHVGGG